jgi:hypothetical protein
MFASSFEDNYLQVDLASSFARPVFKDFVAPAYDVAIDTINFAWFEFDSVLRCNGRQLVFEAQPRASD